MQVDNPVWSAPEVILDELITLKVDVFAFGIMMWETLTQLFPYDVLMEEYVFTNKLCDAICKWNVRPVMPKTLAKECPPLYLELMKKCWEAKAEDRPSFMYVLNTMKRLLDIEKKRLSECREKSKEKEMNGEENRDPLFKYWCGLEGVKGQFCIDHQKNVLFHYVERNSTVRAVDIFSGEVGFSSPLPYTFSVFIYYRF